MDDRVHRHVDRFLGIHFKRLDDDWSWKDIPDQSDQKLVKEFRSLIGIIGYCSTSFRYDFMMLAL